MNADQRPPIFVVGCPRSGTTLLAAERVGRRAHVLEIDPGFVDLTIRRWQAFTGEMAKRASDDVMFEELASEPPSVGEAS